MKSLSPEYGIQRHAERVKLVNTQIRQINKMLIRLEEVAGMPRRLLEMSITFAGRARKLVVAAAWKEAASCVAQSLKKLEYLIHKEEVNQENRPTYLEVRRQLWLLHEQLIGYQIATELSNLKARRKVDLIEGAFINVRPTVYS